MGDRGRQPELVGRTGIVTIECGGGESLGEVELSFAGGTEKFLAVSATPIERDRPVLVIGERDDRVVEVEPWMSMPT